MLMFSLDMICHYDSLGPKIQLIVIRLHGTNVAAVLFDASLGRS